MRLKFFITIGLLFLSVIGLAQLTAKGPECVLPGIEYQYKWDGKEKGIVRVCISGGKILGTSDNCLQDSSLITIRVIWNQDDETGSLTFSGNGALIKSVRIIPPLNPGTITDSLIRIPSGDIPPLLSCSAASGGSCSPVYSYQWEKSVDKVSWEPVKGATALNLAFESALGKPTFFRRRVSDSASNSEDYTKAVAVFMIASPGQ